MWRRREIGTERIETNNVVCSFSCFIEYIRGMEISLRIKTNPILKISP